MGDFTYLAKPQSSQRSYLCELCTASRENLRKPRRFSWRTHSCVPRRDSSRRLPESSPEPGLDMSVEAAGTSACATALVAAPLLCTTTPENRWLLRRFWWDLAFSLPPGFARRLVAAPLPCAFARDLAAVFRRRTIGTCRRSGT